MPRPGIPPSDGERGSVLIVFVVLLLSVGALISAQLTKVVAEKKKVRAVIYAARAQAMADAEMERAKNIVNSAAYVGGDNSALRLAIASSPPFIAGTSVEVARVGDADGDWFVLRSNQSYQGFTRTAQSFVRQKKPATAYNFFVMDHPLGVSGAPRGLIHTNKKLSFYFPNGLYRDQVTASEGFGWSSGANEGNTRLLGPWDDHAERMDMLSGVNLDEAVDHPDSVLSLPGNVVAEIEFRGRQMLVRKFQPQYEITVEKVGTRQVFSHFETRYRDERQPIIEQQPEERRRAIYEWVTQTVLESYPVYDTRWVDVTRTEPIYEDRLVTWTEDVPIWGVRTVSQPFDERYWVEDPPPSPDQLEGGGAVAGGGSYQTGHWETRTAYRDVQEPYVTGYDTVTRSRRERVKVGENTWTETVQQTFIVRWDERWVDRRVRQFKEWEYYWVTRDVIVGYNTVQVPYQAPVYTTEEYTYFEQQTVPERFLGEELVATDGVLYVEGGVRRMQGDINGQLSVVTKGPVTITGSIRYVDDAGNTRMLHGADPAQKYTSNPDYSGKAILGIIADQDVTYGLDAPARLEVNASITSLNGKVAFEGIEVSADGETISVNKDRSRRSDYVKESIRRLGGVISRFRPVTTFIDSDNRVVAGFEKATTLMDRAMLQGIGGGVSLPWSVQDNSPMWSLATKGRLITPTVTKP